MNDITCADPAEVSSLQDTVYKLQIAVSTLSVIIVVFFAVFMLLALNITPSNPIPISRPFNRNRNRNRSVEEGIELANRGPGEQSVRGNMAPR